MTPFLLVPGLNCDPRVFSGVAQALWPFGPVSIANHQTGNRVEEIAEAVLADAPPRFALLGFSMGGYVAFEILRRAPERVLKLALLDTTARPDTEESTANRRRLIALAQGGKYVEAVEQTFPKAVHPDNESNSDLHAVHRGMAEANGPTIFEQQQEAIINRPDSRPLLASIGVPTLIVVGEADQITPPEAAQEMHEGISGSTLVRVPRAGHMALLEQPEPVHAALREWAEA
ncbi:MAG TPA: alpha/beta hydrolase [Devosia sp.]|jgi:pimeloyl-ACP methyl ester carboxylesterase|nr:alpha/beta hydrolase [Devosia sp.]